VAVLLHHRAAPGRIGDDIVGVCLLEFGDGLLGEVACAVEIAGVEVGRVDSITLDKDYQARVRMTIRPEVKLQEDSIASIKTKGLIGERYIRISPGGSDRIIAPNGRIKEVAPPVDFEELLSKYIFGKV